MNGIGSIRNFGYNPNLYTNHNISFKQNDTITAQNNKQEIEELKKEHSKTRKILIGVSAVSALAVSCLLLRNHSLAKKAKVNADAIKTKLKDVVQKIKDTTKNQSNAIKSSSYDSSTTIAADILDALTDIALWA